MIGMLSTLFLLVSITNGASILISELKESIAASTVSRIFSLSITPTFRELFFKESGILVDKLSSNSTSVFKESLERDSFDRESIRRESILNESNNRDFVSGFSK